MFGYLYAIQNKYTVIYDTDDDNKYTLLELSKELPVCWECGASYSNIENEHQNKYLTFIDSIECCICLKTDNGVSFPNCIHYTCILFRNTKLTKKSSNLIAFL